MPASQLRCVMRSSWESACYGNADYGGKLSAKCVVGRDERIAGHNSVAGEEVAGVAARLADEQDTGRAVPGVDVAFAVGLAAARSDVGEPERAGSDPADRAPGP